MEYSLLTSCCLVFDVFVVEQLYWNLCCGIFVVESSLLNRCCGVCVVFVVVYMLRGLTCGLFCGLSVVE